jgi:hypothetical protein
MAHLLLVILHCTCCALVFVGVWYFGLALLAEGGAIVPSASGSVGGAALLHSGFWGLGLSGAVRGALDFYRLARTKQQQQHADINNTIKNNRGFVAGMLFHLFFTLAAIFFAIGFFWSRRSAHTGKYPCFECWRPILLHVVRLLVLDRSVRMVPCCWSWRHHHYE